MRHCSNRAIKRVGASILRKMHGIVARRLRDTVIDGGHGQPQAATAGLVGIVPMYAEGSTCTSSSTRSLLAELRMPSESHVSSMRRPAASPGTRNEPRSAFNGGRLLCSPASSTILQPTAISFSTKLPVVYVLRPVMRQEPSG